MSQESKTPQLDALAKLLNSAINRAYDQTELMILVPIANQWIDKIRADLIAGAALEAEKGSSNGLLPDDESLRETKA